ncbi:hypothetical protein [Thorsellia anophelis]|nr:hypothetical protein [Thorsellia anophelis]
MKHKLIKPLMIGLLIASSIQGVYAEDVVGRTYMSTDALPGPLLGHAPGIEVTVTTNSACTDGVIYTGNTLTIDYRLLDTDLDWANESTKAEMEAKISWYFLTEDAEGNFVLDGDGTPFKTGGLTYEVQPEDAGKIIGISIKPMTTTGDPNTTAEPLEVFDLRTTHTLVPQGQEMLFENQVAGTAFNNGYILGVNNITNVVIQPTVPGQECGVIQPTDDIEIVLYKNIAPAKQAYEYEELPFDQTEGKLKVKTYYAVKVFAKEPDPANPGGYIRGANITGLYKDKLVWELVDVNDASNRVVVEANYIKTQDKDYFEFKTQELNNEQSQDGVTQPATLAKSIEHQSQQGMKFEISITE